ncbi:MAG: Phosphoserine phosphatase 1 [Phycisphaerae bacterium]|nr:Phosphoserine phosphatase 1 [Phycisphaerae bacterium]
MKVALIPVGASEWGEAGRLLGRAEVSLTSRGRKSCADWARTLRSLHPSRVYHSSDDLAAQTAGLIADAIDAPVKEVRDLDEVDVGLWAGLTEAQLKQRYTSAYRQLCDAPLGVRAPEGEDFDEASRRLVDGITRLVRKNGAPAVAVVLRPLALTMVRCALEGRRPQDLLSAVRDHAAPIVIDMEATGPRAPAQEKA